MEGGSSFRNYCGEHNDLQGRGDKNTNTGPRLLRTDPLRFCTAKQKSINLKRKIWDT
jgi:hypothetical protein